PDQGQGQGQEAPPVDQVATAINRMADILERMEGPQGQGQGQGQAQPVGQVGGEDRALERFQKFNPPKFLGGSDPEEAEMWLERITDIFSALDYTEDRQISFASFQFEGPARAWWNMIRTKWEVEMIPRTWPRFLREFNAKYLPPIVQERREEAFLRCRQGTQSVAEYETQFTKLARYAPELVGTEQRRIRKFIHGLNVELQEGLATTRVETFGEAIEMAQRLESAKALVKNFQAKRKGGPGGSRGPGESSAPPL
ncbi:MAG: Cysteine synthase (EC, partial [uncultured Caballeronia sp.]